MSLQELQRYIKEHLFGKSRLIGSRIKSLPPEIVSEVNRLTKSLDGNTDLITRIKLISAGVTELPTCPVCKARPVAISKDSHCRIHKTCGRECSAVDPRRLEKIERTNGARYGGHPMNNDAVKRRVEKTFLARYGTKCSLQNEAVKKKAAAALLKNYGVVVPSKSIIVKEKTKQTNKKRYGCEHPMQHPEVYDKFKTIMLQRHGVEHAKHELPLIPID